MKTETTMKPEPTFDADGYPTDETLDTIKAWPLADGLRELLAFVKAAWKYTDWGWGENDTVNDMDRPVRRYSISTGGWSGNETLLDALRDNAIFWSLCWVQSRRGGHYLFEVEGR